VPVRIKVDGDAAAQGLLRPGLSVVVDIDTREPQADQTADHSTSAQ
jgi:membrane fusion protein (multidrug efflux system)